VLRRNAGRIKPDDVMLVEQDSGSGMTVLYRLPRHKTRSIRRAGDESALVKILPSESPAATKNPARRQTGAGSSAEQRVAVKLLRS
jgi:hypothetical protein